MPVRLEPRDRLVVRPEVKVGPAARQTRPPAAQEVVPEHAQRVYHCQQLEDMRQVVLLRRRQLAALVRHRVLVPLVVWLRQDRRDSNVARVRREHSALGRVEVA